MTKDETGKYVSERVSNQLGEYLTRLTTDKKEGEALINRIENGNPSIIDILTFEFLKDIKRWL